MKSNPLEYGLEYPGVLRDRATGYGDLATQDRVTGVASQQSMPASVPASAPASSPAAPATLDEIQKEVDDAAKEFQPRFENFFTYEIESKKRLTCGPSVGDPVKAKVLKRSDFDVALRREQINCAEDLADYYLTFAPSIVLYRLEEFYKVFGLGRLPYRNSKGDVEINKDTKLEESDRKHLVGLAQKLAEILLPQDVVGFCDSRNDDIYLLYREDFPTKEETILRTRDSLAHEMAHAYCSESFEGFCFLLAGCHMPGADKLVEGITMYLAHRFLIDYYKSVGLVRSPFLGYDSCYANTGSEFVKWVSKTIARDHAKNATGIPDAGRLIIDLAYFGGWAQLPPGNLDPDHPPAHMLFAFAANKKELKTSAGNKMMADEKYKVPWPWSSDPCLDPLFGIDFGD